ncbi:MAG: SIMPL domain-containing protein, partial [Flavobacteriales bacterium]
IESNEVEKVEQISREVTELIDQGIEFYSDSPRYYYTKLNELKIEMLAEASKDATLRAQQMATNAGSKLGNLRSADMGIFQITGSHSEEEYSWGGTLNTSSKNKTASITVRMQFDL